MTPAEYDAWAAATPAHDPWYGRVFNALFGTVAWLATGRRH